MRQFFFLILLTTLLSACGTSTTAPTTQPQPTRETIVTVVTAIPTALPIATPIPAATSTPTITPEPNPELTAMLEKVDVWDDPANEGSYWHRETQLILGEPVRLLAERGDWVQIAAVEQPSRKHALGYPGWVRRSQLTPGWMSASEWLVVMVRMSRLRIQPDSTSPALIRLPLDVRLPVINKNAQWVEARLPDGRSGWVELKDIRLAADPNQPIPQTRLLAIAETMVGIGYLWGGTSGDALDCSGFLYRLFHAHGTRLMRDADDLAQQGTLTETWRMQPGDFIFYTDVSTGPITHVGMYWGKSQLIDAEPDRGVTIHTLTEVSKNYVYHSVRQVK